MTENSSDKRAQLVRESFVFQLKLIVDGFRDFVLVPVSLAATLIGLLRSGEDPEREFERVLELGRQSEQWIDLFGQHAPLFEAGEAGSFDRLVSRAEAVLRDETARGDVTDQASKAIGRALETLRESLRGRRKPGAGDQ